MNTFRRLSYRAPLYRATCYAGAPDGDTILFDFDLIERFAGIYLIAFIAVPRNDLMRFSCFHTFQLFLPLPAAFELMPLCYLHYFDLLAAS